MLDVGHEQQVLELVDDLRRDAGLTVVSTLHDLTVAGQYADSLVLLDAGRVVAAGSPATVLTAPLIESVYAARVRVIAGDDGHPVIAPVRPVERAGATAGCRGRVTARQHAVNRVGGAARGRSETAAILAGDGGRARTVPAGRARPRSSRPSWRPRLAHSLGLPALLVFLGLGLALGENGIGIRFDNAGLAEALGLGALVLILAEGGLTTNWEHARRAAPAAVAAGHRRRHGQHRGGRRVHALDARPRLAAGAAARRGARADRRGRRLLRAAQAAAAAAAQRACSRGSPASTTRRPCSASPCSAQHAGHGTSPLLIAGRGGLAAGGRRGDRRRGRPARHDCSCGRWRCPPPACTRSRCSR